MLLSIACVCETELSWKTFDPPDFQHKGSQVRRGKIFSKMEKLVGKYVKYILFFFGLNFEFVIVSLT